MHDQESGANYYVNLKTKQSTWQIPGIEHEDDRQESSLDNDQYEQDPMLDDSNIEETFT